jgi:hypothetical protein
MQPDSATSQDAGLYTSDPQTVGHPPPLPGGGGVCESRGLKGCVVWKYILSVIILIWKTKKVYIYCFITMEESKQIVTLSYNILTAIMWQQRFMAHRVILYSGQ